MHQPSAACASLSGLLLALGCSGGLQAAGNLKLDSKAGLSAKMDAKTSAKVDAKAGPGSSKPKEFGPAVDDALSGAQRSEENRARDVYRHPKETLAFFGLKTDMSVLEVEPGADGWYSEILAPVLRDHGKYLVTNFDPNGPEKSPLTKVAKAFQAKLDANPGVYDKVQIVTLSEDYDLGEPDSVDMVVTFRNSHLWKQDKIEDRVYGAVFKVLKPGGVLGLVQHRACAGDKPSRTYIKGYLPQPYVIERVEKAGFVFEAESHVNANSWDTKDYPKGVWTLPPSLALGDKDRAKYEKIGESDRMTLRFRKPASSEPAAKSESNEPKPKASAREPEAASAAAPSSSAASRGAPPGGAPSASSAPSGSTAPPVSATPPVPSAVPATPPKSAAPPPTTL
jgi:predicted methyltransferase